MNTQLPEPRLKTDGSILEVHSIFATIQGEGPFAGRRAVFIRLAGCNLQCPMCDTEYSENRTEMTVNQILTRVRTRINGRNDWLIVITGGEPFRQELKLLLLVLNNEGYTVQIETNGTLPVNPDIYFSKDFTVRSVFLVCSPKTGSVHPSIYYNACAFKYVVDAKHVTFDHVITNALLHPAKPRLAQPPSGIPVYVQPADEKDDVANKKNIAAAIDLCYKMNYIFQLQIHKIIGVE